MAATANKASPPRILRGVEIPDKVPYRPRFPYDEMKHGDAFDMPERDLWAARQAFYRWRRRHGLSHMRLVSFGLKDGLVRFVLVDDRIVEADKAEAI